MKEAFLKYYLWEDYMWEYRDALRDQSRAANLLKAFRFWRANHNEEAEPHIVQIFMDIMYDYFIANGDGEIDLANEFRQTYQEIFDDEQG